MIKVIQHPLIEIAYLVGSFLSLETWRARWRRETTQLSVLLIEKYEESMSTIIQRSMSERSREKCLRLHISGGHPIVECSHRVARRMCRHAGSKLRHQARLEYVQSTPNVATMHNGKHVAANSRGGTGDVNGSVLYVTCYIPIPVVSQFFSATALETSRNTSISITILRCINYV